MNLQTKIHTTLMHHHQEDLWEHFKNLPAAEQEILGENLSRIHFPLMEALFYEYRRDDGESSADISPLQRNEYHILQNLGDPPPEILTLGENYLKAGKLAVVLLAGGVGSRLAFPAPKGMFPITPLTQKTLFEVHFEKMRVMQQKYSVALRIYLMTSRATHDATRAYLAEHDYFGMSPQRVFLFEQGEMPAFSPETGSLLLKNPREICLGPDGHGGLLTALLSSGAYADMENHGVESIFTFHVDNPLVPIADPGILGCHLEAESEMSLLAVRKTGPQERVGNVVRRGGKNGKKASPAIVEYLDFPDSLASQRDAEDSLKYWAGSIGIHIFDLSFLRRMTEMVIADPLSLPWHFPLKKMTTLSGEVWGIKPERFIFDILPFSRYPLVLAVDREATFAVLKDDPDVVTAHLDRLYKKWLRNAGVIFPENAVVEIAPSFALYEEEVRGRLPAGTVLEGERIYLS